MKKKLGVFQNENVKKKKKRKKKKTLYSKDFQAFIEIFFGLAFTFYIS